MRRMLAFLMVVALSAPGSSAFAASARSGAASGSIAGTATSSDGQTLGRTSVRLRSLTDKQIVSTVKTTASGQFSFAGIPAGDYTVEVLNAAGEIVGTSAPIALTAESALVSGVTVTTWAAKTAGSTGSSFFASTAGRVLLVAAGASVAAVTVAANQTTASPSK